MTKHEPVRLDDLTNPQRQLVVALVKAAGRWPRDPTTQSAPRPAIEAKR
jgi:hypothetical protein